MREDYIYLDYAANTPVDDRVLEVFCKETKKYFANPNSTHELGKIVNKRIEDASVNINSLLTKNTNMDEDMEIIYTSGASESNNLGLRV